MTLKSSPCRQASKSDRKKRRRMIALSLGSALVGAMLSLILFVQSKWDRAVVVGCAIYCVIASIFMALQIWGFVASQTLYSEEIEEAKFKMIEDEEAEWATA